MSRMVILVVLVSIGTTDNDGPSFQYIGDNHIYHEWRTGTTPLVVDIEDYR